MEDQLPEEMLLGQYIPLHYHYNMLQDQSRMLPFREAISYAVPFGSTVLELGGGTGVLSHFAAQRAAKVYCVERNPALVRAARNILDQNTHGDRVEVIQADAMKFVPPEPVDVVICEMLHVGLIREKQTDVIRAFKENYRKVHGPKLPAFVPDTSLLAVQLMDQNYDFCGYHASVPIFRPPGPHAQSRYVADPEIYATVAYDAEIPTEFRWQGKMVVRRSGNLNAISFLTKNFLAFVLSENRAVEWMMNQLILPLPEPLQVQQGQSIAVEFAYSAGCPLEHLQQAVHVGEQAVQLSVRHAA